MGYDASEPTTTTKGAGLMASRRSSPSSRPLPICRCAICRRAAGDAFDRRMAPPHPPALPLPLGQRVNTLAEHQLERAVDVIDHSKSRTEQRRWASACFAPWPSAARWQGVAS